MLSVGGIGSFLQNLSIQVADIVRQQEINWQYELPTFKLTIVSLAFSLDGTCMHLSQCGW